MSRSRHAALWLLAHALFSASLMSACRETDVPPAPSPTSESIPPPELAAPPPVREPVAAPASGAAQPPSAPREMSFAQKVAAGGAVSARLAATDDLWLITHSSAVYSDRTPAPRHYCGAEARRVARRELANLWEFDPVECSRFPCTVPSDAEEAAQLHTRRDGSLRAIAWVGAPLIDSAEAAANRAILRTLRQVSREACP